MAERRSARPPSLQVSSGSAQRVEVGASGASPFPVMTDRIAPGLPGSPQASMLTLTLPLNPYFTLNQESLLSLCPHLARACLPL